jgi:hypothetical protein
MPAEKANIKTVCGTSQEDMGVSVSHVPQPAGPVPVVSFEKKKVPVADPSVEDADAGVEYYRKLQRITHEVYSFKKRKRAGKS